MAAGIRLLVLLTGLLAPTFLLAGEIIKSIEINGLRYSNERIVLRELPFKVGDEWRSEDGYIGERRLRNLGLFSEAVIFPPDEQGVVKVWARDRWSLWLLPEASRSDGGSSSAGFALNEYNMWGLHHHLRVASRWDTGKNFTAGNGGTHQAAYIWRRVADSNFGLDIGVDRGRSIYDAYSNSVFQGSYVKDTTSWRGGVRYGLGEVPGEGWELRLGFAMSNNRYVLDSGIPVADVQDSRRRALAFSAEYQMVDDQLTWLTGSQFAYQLEVAHRALSSTINAYRQTASWHRYIDLDQQKVLAMRLEGGLVTGDILNDGLFDVGDGKAIRGYYPGDIQGSAYIYSSVEGRIPWEVGSNVQFVGFVDVGHVQRDGKRALGKSLIVGAGTGVRWTLRWLVQGTLRADIAYGVATHKWRLHLGTGHSF